MDLLIEKAEASTRLSYLGFYNIDIEDGSPSSEVGRRTVKGRSGYILDGVTFVQKTIKVTGRLVVAGQRAFMEKRDELNGWFMDDEAFYIAKMVPSSERLYDFELPGRKTGELDLKGIAHEPWKYRYKVVCDGAIDFSFLGRSSQGLKYNVSFQFVTAELPYGETRPKDIAVSSGTIAYSGTAPLSQLEWPFKVELTSNGGQSSFFLEIGGRRFTYNYGVALQAGDKLMLSGVETTLKNVNVNNRTNYEYFVLRPTPTKKIPYTTNFSGSIRLLNFVELYK